MTDNPVLTREWQTVRNYLDDEQLAGLLQISIGSMQSYACSERRTPEAVVAKLRWLALTIGRLTGSYNEFGVLRWFQRPRTALGNRSPQDVLLAESNWRPGDEAAQRIAALAKASAGMTVT